MRNRDRIDGILVCLPNFGDEKGVADAIRLSDLNVPILVQACPDDLGSIRARHAVAMPSAARFQSATIFVNMGIKFGLTHDHTAAILSDAFREDLLDFFAICRVVRGMRRVRIGAVGARPNAFNTTRYSEKLLESAGISVNTIDLSEVFGSAALIANDDPKRETAHRVQSAPTPKALRLQTSLCARWPSSRSSSTTG